ncbi:MAG: hypothetical protein AB1505_17910 [Candidatus Latescibacterota bacterium]
MIKVQIKGFDEMRRNLRRLKERASALHGSHTVPLEELLTPGFIGRHTRGCSSASEWFQKSGFKIESEEDLAAIRDAWDEYVRSTTSFPTWQAMLEAAGAAMVKKKLFG